VQFACSLCSLLVFCAVWLSFVAFASHAPSAVCLLFMNFLAISALCLSFVQFGCARTGKLHDWRAKYIDSKQLHKEQEKCTNSKQNAQRASEMNREQANSRNDNQTAKKISKLHKEQASCTNGTQTD
jgi:hypothetical protein